MGSVLEPSGDIGNGTGMNAAIETAPAGPGASMSFAGTSFCHLSFRGLARRADLRTLSEVLQRLLARHPRMPFALLDAYADRCLALGNARSAIGAYRAAAVLEPSLGDSLHKLLALATRTGRKVPDNWSRIDDLLSRARPWVLSELVRLESEHCFGSSRHYDVLEAIGRIVRPRLYFEIGVNQGHSLDVCHPEARQIAVDPEPHVDPKDYPRLELHRTTSDAYFAAAFEEPDHPAVDLAFIDGLHEANQVLRDFRNTERLCRPGSTIILHDILPLHPVSAEPTRRLVFWVGDCWRALCLLMRERPDLDVAIIPAGPSGLAVIRDLDPASRRLDALGPAAADELDRLSIERDFVPMLLKVRWVEPTEAALSAHFAGGRPPEAGTRFRFTADEAFMLAAARAGGPDAGSLTRLKTRLAFEPGSPLSQAEIARYFHPEEVRREHAALFHRVCMRALCVKPLLAALRLFAGTFLVDRIEAGEIELVSGLHHGGHLHSKYHQVALLEAKLRQALEVACPAPGDAMTPAVVRATDRIADRLPTLARESGLPVEVTRHLAFAYAAAVAATGRAEGPVVERVGPFEAWRTDPASTAAAEPSKAAPPYNRIGFNGTRFVPDARLTRRRGIRRPTEFPGSHNNIAIHRLDHAFITDGMVVGSHRDGLLLGRFVQLGEDRVLTVDIQHSEAMPGLIATYPGGALLEAPGRTERMNGIATPGYSRRNSDVFGHFILDSLGRVLAARDHVGTDDLVVALPCETPAFVEAIYRWFGLRHFHIIADHTRVAFDEVVTTDISAEALANFPLYDVLRRHTSTVEPATGARRLYLSRRRVARPDRELANEAELERALEETGFRIVHPQELSFEDQVALYRGADTIVSHYGSALHVAAVFCRPGTRIVEIETRRSPDELVTFYQHLGHDYATTRARWVGEGTSSYTVSLPDILALAAGPAR